LIERFLIMLSSVSWLIEKDKLSELVKALKNTLSPSLNIPIKIDVSSRIEATSKKGFADDIAIANSKAPTPIIALYYL